MKLALRDVVNSISVLHLLEYGPFVASHGLAAFGDGIVVPGGHVHGGSAAHGYSHVDLDLAVLLFPADAGLAVNRRCRVFGEGDIAGGLWAKNDVLVAGLVDVGIHAGEFAIEPDKPAAEHGVVMGAVVAPVF